jgi:hypothetical protein
MDDSARGVARTPKRDPSLPDDIEARAMEIRAEIADTRADMSETIDAIQERLSPAHLAEGAKQRVRNATTQKVQQMANTAEDAMDQVLGSTFGETVRANPIPAAMIGIGAAWLLFKGRSGAGDRDNRGYSARYRTARSYGTPNPGEYGPGADDSERYGAVGTLGSGTLASAASRARSTVDDMTSRVQSATDSVRETTRRTTRGAQLKFEDVLQSNPLALGAAAVLIGAVVGMSVPQTDTENEWMGDARDAVVDRAKDMASTAADRVGDAADNIEKLASRVKDQTRDIGSSSGSPSKESGGTAETL